MSTRTSDGGQDVGPRQAADLVEEGAILLDVREDDEWAAGHAPRATHIPMGEVGARVSELPAGSTLVCVCHLGGRSAAVAAALRSAGWDARNLDGGMDAWARAGLPVVGEGGVPGRVV